MDPMSIALGAAIGGATSKFIEKAWDSGERWLQTYFKDHGEKSNIKAKENSIEFLDELAKRIKHLEDSRQISQEKIDLAQDHPDFSFMLQKALLTSAQTDSREKHFLLARLVSERLKAEPESIVALSSKMACNAIAGLTVNQLRILGLAASLLYMRPTDYPDEIKTNEEFQELVDEWITKRIIDLKDVFVRQIDIIHLESLACLSLNEIRRKNINDLLKHKNFSYDFNKMKNIDLRKTVMEAWNTAFGYIYLTSVGIIIGTSVIDQITKTNTNLTDWD